MSTTILLLSVSQLPDGYFKDQLSVRVQDPDVANVYVVAKTGLFGDWAAYIGWPTINNIRPELRADSSIQHYCQYQHAPDAVEATGDKLDRETACALFPSMKPQAYRR